MKRSDARKLDRKTLKVKRIRVARRVQEDESPEVIVRLLLVLIERFGKIRSFSLQYAT